MCIYTHDGRPAVMICISKTLTYLLCACAPEQIRLRAREPRRRKAKRKARKKKKESKEQKAKRLEKEQKKAEKEKERLEAKKVKEEILKGKRVTQSKHVVEHSKIKLATLTIHCTMDRAGLNDFPLE